MPLPDLVNASSAAPKLASQSLSDCFIRIMPLHDLVNASSAAPKLASQSVSDKSADASNTTMMTPTKKELQQEQIVANALVSPDFSIDSPSHSVSEEGEDDSIGDLDNVCKRIGKSDHKIAEESGKHQPEPLLMENPNRFVLFPIQDNEVRSNMTGYPRSSPE